MKQVIACKWVLSGRDIFRAFSISHLVHIFYNENVAGCCDTVIKYNTITHSSTMAGVEYRPYFVSQLQTGFCYTCYPWLACTWNYCTQVVQHLLINRGIVCPLLTLGKGLLSKPCSSASFFAYLAVCQLATITMMSWLVISQVIYFSNCSAVPS